MLGGYRRYREGISQQQRWSQTWNGPPAPGSLNSPEGKPMLSVEGELGQCVQRVCTAWPVWEIPGGPDRGSAVLGDAGLQRRDGQI